MNDNKLMSVIEGILFAWGDAIETERLCDALEISEDRLKELLEKMMVNYQNEDRGIMLRELNGLYQLCTKIENHEIIEKLYKKKVRQSLSKSAYETLAIIAYNSPATKGMIDDIKGVSCDSTVNTLLEKNLIKEAGKLDTPGRPTLYEVSEEFFRSFGISSLEELPVITEEMLDN